MKIFITTFIFFVFAQGASAAPLSALMLKRDLTLSPLGGGGSYSAEMSACFDVKSKTEIQSASCPYSSINKRLCHLYIYNFRSEPGKLEILAGTEFVLAEQMGPKISHDWSKKTSFVKLFYRLKGAASPLSNPNLILECAETKKGFFAPALFTENEIQTLFEPLFLY